MASVVGLGKVEGVLGVHNSHTASAAVVAAAAAAVASSGGNPDSLLG